MDRVEGLRSTAPSSPAERARPRGLAAPGRHAGSRARSPTRC